MYSKPVPNEIAVIFLVFCMSVIYFIVHFYKGDYIRLRAVFIVISSTFSLDWISFFLRSWLFPHSSFLDNGWKGYGL